MLHSCRFQTHRKAGYHIHIPKDANSYTHTPLQLDSDSGICPDHDEQNPPGIFPRSLCTSILRRRPTTVESICSNMHLHCKPEHVCSSFHSMEMATALTAMMTVNLAMLYSPTVTWNNTINLRSKCTLEITLSKQGCALYSSIILSLHSWHILQGLPGVTLCSLSSHIDIIIHHMRYLGRGCLMTVSGFNHSCAIKHTCNLQVGCTTVWAVHTSLIMLIPVRQQFRSSKNLNIIFSLS